ncbi:MAG TPA: type III-A CRISPR-associated RAMP protein Csm5 [Syntrophorhabdaceae bacterium]|nr:type III-A CRISPR-associated RAMP protein Csm5 [Syntrophorhabdaceae bacterium]
MLDEVFEARVGVLSTLTPIHIGGVEQKLTPFEYIIKNGYVYHISEEMLSKFLAKLNLIDKFVIEFEREGHRFRILDFLQKQKVQVDNNYLLNLSGGRRAKLDTDPLQMQDYKPFMRDGMGNIYIPGTSIKGVIRTAILYCILKNLKEKDPTQFSTQIEKRIEQDIRNKKNKKRMFERGNEEWLQSFLIDDKKGSPHTDWLKMLHITDAYPEKHFEPIIIPVNVLKKEKNGWQLKKDNTGKPTTIWVECIPENVSFRFQMTWDRRLLTEFSNSNSDIKLPKNLEEIMKNIEEWTYDVIKAEKSFFSNQSKVKFYDFKTLIPNFRMGFGSGMMATTIFPLLSDDLRKKIRNYAGLNRGNDEAPKSRRIWIREDSYIPLGWNALKIMPYEKGNPIFFENKMPVSTKKEQAQNMIQLEAIAQLEEEDRKIPPKQSPQPITWPGAYVTYSPGNKTLIASYENKKAELKIGDDKSIVPERYHKTLFEKRKGIKANIIVEPLGNAFKIVRIDEN